MHGWRRIHAHTDIHIHVHAGIHKYADMTYHRTIDFGSLKTVSRTSPDAPTSGRHIRAINAKSTNLSCLACFKVRNSVIYHDDDIVADISTYRSISRRAPCLPTGRSTPRALDPGTIRKRACEPARGVTKSVVDDLVA